MCKKEVVGNLFSSSLLWGIKSCVNTTEEIETWFLWTRCSELHLSVGFFWFLYFYMSSKAALFCFPIMIDSFSRGSGLHCGRIVELPVLIYRSFL